MDIKKERIFWMDLLNISACICVCLLHTNFQYLDYSGSITFPWLYGCFIFTIAFWAVPVFIALSVCKLVCYKSGVVDFYKRRITKILVPFIFWSILYGVIYWFQNGSFSVQEGIYLFTHGLFNGYMWFFTPLFGLYLSMPFLKVFVQNASQKLIWLFIFFGFVFESLFPFVFDLCGIPYLFIGNDYKQPAFFSMASNFIYIGLMGYMLVHVEIPVKYRKILYISGFLTAIIHFLFLFGGTIIHGSVVRIELNYFYPSSVIIPAAVIVFFRYFDWSKLFTSTKLRNLISILSSCSLGVYLIQRALQIYFEHYPFFLYNFLTGFLLLYVVGVLITLVFKKIPFLRRCV